ncbi:MAG: hypothetical protein GY719_06300 [bacterium]|nr:hypothetical protein [bacterium]
MRPTLSVARFRYRAKLAVVGSILLAILGLSQVAQADHRILYTEGLRSFEFEKYQEALMLFDAASREQPSEGEWVRPYGMRYEAYLPHYYLGACLYHLGRYEQALEAWRESERQGSILKRKNRYWHRQMESLRHELDIEIPTLTKSLRAEVSSAFQQFQIARVAAATASAGAQIETRLAEVEVALAAIHDELENDESAAGLAGVRFRLDRTWKHLELVVLAIRRQEETAAVAEKARLEAERQRMLEADRRRASALLADGACVPDAIELLEKIHDRLVARKAKPVEASNVYLKLAQAHLQCDELSLAEHHFQLAQSHDGSTPPIEEFRRRLRDARQRRRMLKQYREAATAIKSGYCSRRAIDGMESLIEEEILPLDVSWTPFLLLSDAHIACGDFDRATAYLERSRERGVAPAEQLATRQRDLDAKQRALNDTLQRVARIALINRVARAIKAGGCQLREIDVLEELRQAPIADTLGLDIQSSLLASLTQGYVACEDPLGAERTLRELRSTASGNSEIISSLESAIGGLRRDQARQHRREEALSDYLEALARVRLGECNEEVMTLIETSQEILGSHRDQSASSNLEKSPPAGYAPFLTLALAHRNCENWAKAQSFLQLARNQQGASNAEIAGLEIWLKQTGLYKESHALLVAAYAYNGGWEPLKGPQEDIKAVRAILERHDFEIQVIENPVSSELPQQIRQFFTEHGQTPENRLLFYFAGHGWTESKHGIRLGYIVPVDATHPDNDRNYLTYLLSMDNFEGYAKEIDSRHALFLFDSCFSGTIFDATKSTVEAQQASVSIDDLVAKPVRLFITAGDETQLVPDFSIFRETVVQALEGEADIDQDGFILGSEIGRFVRSEVSLRSQTTPQWGTMTLGELGLGDILFKNASAGSGLASEKVRTALSSELEYWIALESSDDPHLYRTYLRRYPKGHFAPLAKLKLARMTHLLGSEGS